MVPESGSGCPCTTAWYTFSTVRSLNARLSAVYADSVLATTISPLVPTSSRCTTPCRSGAPLVAIRNPAAARAPTTVGPPHPTDGCAATPVGLSTTTMSSSSWTIPSSGTWTGMILGSSRGVQVTSSQPPARRRSDLPSGAPSRLTPPDSATSAAKVREKPSIFASAASTREPSSPSGTGMLRDCISGPAGRRLGIRARRPGGTGRGVVLRMVAFAGAVQLQPDDDQQRDRDHPRDDEDVGHVEDRRDHPGHRDHVDHVADGEPGGAEQPVGEVTEHAAEQAAEHDRPQPGPHTQRLPDDDGGDHRQGDREDPGHA